MKIFLYVLIIIIFSICLVCFSDNAVNNKVLAASGNSTSDLQLMARAINRRG